VKYLADERWYVVRNMCGVLAELSDPQLVEHIAPALRHSDARVQQSALKALVKTRDGKTAATLADALPFLSPHILDEALDELMYLKSLHTIAALEAFATSSGSNPVRAIKAVYALGAIADVAALYALGRLFRVEELDSRIRRAALAAISQQRSAIATRLLEELSTSWGPLAEEARKELDKRTIKPN
jgi:HEAT repeat protein